MSFFTRKPNPPVPVQATQKLRVQLPPATSQQLSAIQSNGPFMTAQNAQQSENQQTPSNTRFRSFAERYIVERCRDWKEGEIDERAWAAILEAKSIYNKVKEVGRTLSSDN